MPHCRQSAVPRQADSVFIGIMFILAMPSLDHIALLLFIGTESSE
jgi:hypothetical protein